MRELASEGIGDRELGQIADKYWRDNELSSEDFLERMNDKERWFINMLKKMKKRHDPS